MEKIARLPNLTLLHFSNADCTDDAVEVLKDHPTLESLGWRGKSALSPRAAALMKFFASREKMVVSQRWDF
jgi:hypothetical protein